MQPESDAHADSECLKLVAGERTHRYKPAGGVAQARPHKKNRWPGVATNRDSRSSMGTDARDQQVETAAIESDHYADDVDLAFHDRFQEVRPRLMAVCRAVVGHDDAEDVVQETYLRARQRIGQLRNMSALEAWLVRIALNEARSVARRRARHQEPLGEGDRPAAGQHRDLALLELVDALPIRERMAVALHYGYGFGLSEVAELIGTSHINARTILFRARRRLRRSWEAGDEQP